jgi:hypothetical protein
LETLSVGQHQSYLFCIGFVNDSAFAQRPFSFGCLFGQNVTGAGFVIDNLSTACFPKSFGGGSICFYLWHLGLSFISGGFDCFLFL